MGTHAQAVQLRLLRLMLKHGFRAEEYTLGRIERYQYTEFTTIRMEGDRIVVETQVLNFVYSTLIIEKDGGSRLEFRID